ncbi:MAG: DUF4013 domain-containing protein [Candidatus Latescibacteria bacterium]|jgi:hypothetical protein|nr:DUF4013 domain-containing protein [Candidatus Latescibacterota bacterium]
MFGILLVSTIRTLFGTPAWWRKIIPGGVLNLLSTQVLVLILAGQISIELGVGLLIITFALLLIAWGYLYRVFVDALNGSETLILPSWSNWRAYALAGFWLLVIALGYSVIAVAGLSMIVSVLGLMPSSAEEAGPLSLLLMFAFIFFYGFFPIVFTRFAAEGRVWAAFEPGPVWQDLKKIARGDYIQACFGLFGVSLLGNLVLGALPQVGLALASAFWFLVMVLFARVLGLLIHLAHKPKGSSPWPVDEPRN